MSQRSRLQALILHTCAALLVLWPSAADAQEAAAPILLHAHRLLDVRSGTYRHDQGLLISGGLITAVGPYAETRGKAPPDAARHLSTELSRHSRRGRG